jgi:deazaflavin-dependent oxidoreductase (nitroreductase family)
MNYLLTALNDWLGPEVVWRVYRLLGGASMARQFLLLRTRGRKTGKQRTVILTYLRAQATWLVVASNGGEALMPAWYHNLRAHPQAEIQVGRRRFQVEAEMVSSEEYEQLWAAWLKQHPAYERAQQQTMRRFPLVRLIGRENICLEVSMQTETKSMAIGHTFPVHPLWVVGALIGSYMGIWVHEFYRVPASRGFTPEGLLSLLLPAVLIFLAWWRFPRHIAPIAALWTLGFVHLLGACVTVLPLAFLPFVPEQTVAHYLVHAVYALAQMPLLLLALRLARRRTMG